MVRSIRLPERLRLVRILRAHGLRHAERLREEELRRALTELGLDVEERERAALAAGAPSSASFFRPRAESPAPPPPAAPAGPFEDPDAAPRFREPPARLPEGERTFLRLVAVEPGLLFATWDLDALFWQNRWRSVDLRLVPADVDDVMNTDLVYASAGVDASVRSFYLPAPGERMLVRAALIGVDESGKTYLLATSNPALVPPSRPAPAGPLWFARLSVRADRRRLRSGLLLRALAGEDVELPEGVAVRRSGRMVGPIDEEPAGAPSSQGGLVRFLGAPSSAAPYSGTFASRTGERS